MTKEERVSPDWIEALNGLARLRRPYDGLLRDTVHASLEQYPVLPELPLVEIGCGSGQLRTWLPSSIAARTIHTDPEQRVLDALRDSSPGADVACAPAQKLPFEDGACGGALALCVFDALGDEADRAAALDELARVLAPGAPFLHFLDMGALLDRAFDEFNEKALVPIPNIFSDPADHEWPLDLLLLDRDWLEQVLLHAISINHPLFALFGPYFSAFLLQPFSRNEAMTRFKWLASDRNAQRSLAVQAVSAFQAAAQVGYPVQPLLPFYSSRYLAESMESAFARQDRFEIQFSGMVTRSLLQRRAGNDAVRYRSLCVGHERISDRMPSRLLSTQPQIVRADNVLLETGVFVFAARRRV